MDTLRYMEIFATYSLHKYSVHIYHGNLKYSRGMFLANILLVYSTVIFRTSPFRGDVGTPGVGTSSLAGDSTGLVGGTGTPSPSPVLFPSRRVGCTGVVPLLSLDLPYGPL